MDLILTRLKDLKKLKISDGSACISRRVQFMVDDLVDLRGNGWIKKSFKEEAKKKEDVREEQAREEREAQKSSHQGAHRQPNKRAGGRH